VPPLSPRIYYFILRMSDPPLKGLKVIGTSFQSFLITELAGLAPAPFAGSPCLSKSDKGMLLADFGADVVRIDRPGLAQADILCRRKRSIKLDLKSSSSKVVLERLLDVADVLIDPYRPGVLEGLQLDPERLRRRNERLVVARLTGFRRDGNIYRVCIDGRQVQGYGRWTSFFSRTDVRTRYQLSRYCRFNIVGKS